MSAKTSTLHAPELRAHPPLKSATAEWRRFRAFVRRPALPDQTGRFSFTAVRRMLALDLIIMMALFTLAAIALILGVTFPENSNSNLEPTLATFALAVILAPLLEELFFRGPLSGKPAHLLAMLTVLVAGAAIALTTSGSAFAMAALVLAPIVLIVLKVTMGKRGRVSWFARNFPLFFWLSCTGFALVHFVNYEDGLALILVPLVAPQFVLGAICGYLRVYYGLWSSILLHAMHNSLALGIAFGLAPLLG